LTTKIKQEGQLSQTDRASVTAVVFETVNSYKFQMSIVGTSLRRCYQQFVQVLETSVGQCRFNSLTPILPCYHMGTAIKYPAPDRVKPLFLIFDIRALRRPGSYDWKLYRNFGERYQNRQNGSAYVLQLIKNYKVYIFGIFILSQVWVGLECMKYS